MPSVRYSEAAKRLLDMVTTAEELLCAVCDLCKRNIDGSPIDPELEKSEKLIISRVGNISVLRGRLLAHILKSRGDEKEADKAYFEKCLRDAEKKAVDRGLDLLSLDMLVETVLSDPSEGMPEAFVTEKNEEREQSPEEKVEKMKYERVSPGALESRREKLPDVVRRTKEIQRALEEEIVGQNKAIDIFCSGYFQSELLALTGEKRERPRATFLFAGPPGVGKTYLARCAAKALGEVPFRRFDMSEYGDKDSTIEFCGSDKVYKNGKAGNVTGFVAANPRCILLFDEIEKASLSVIHLFLQILDAGTLRDNYTDEKVSFSDAVIIFTTNAGKQLYEEYEGGDLSAVSRKVILKALQRDVDPRTGAPYFPAAICSRFASGNVVMFNHMKASDLIEIARREMSGKAKKLSEGLAIDVDIAPSVYTALLLSEGASVDARTIRARAEAFFDNELFELFRLTEAESVATGIGDIERISIGVDLTGAAEDVVALFEKKERTRVLAFARDREELFCNDAEICRADTLEGAKAILESEVPEAAFIDLSCGQSGSCAKYLNIEDMASEARDLLHLIREEHPSLPVYILETDEYRYDPEERISFMRQGVGRFISINDCECEISAICESIHQQRSIERLGRANKLLTFETAQHLCDGGREARILLFDPDLDTAIEAEDSENVLSGVCVPNVSFDDVIGAEEGKAELEYFANYLKDPAKYVKKGIGAPRGILLYGPSGTGKTMLAKAMANKAGVTFICAEGNRFLKKYLGEGSEKVHELFRVARKYAPSVIFIDEIDAIGRSRNASREAGGEEILTALLTEMDGFKNDSAKPVFVLAATNVDAASDSAGGLDSALLRRFDRRIYIDLPGKEARAEFIRRRVQASELFSVSDDERESITVRSTGMSLSDLDSILESAMRAAVRGGGIVTDSILDEAFESFTGGEKKTWDVSRLRRTAIHEAGHAVICALGGSTPSYLTVVARGDRGGYMRYGERDTKAVYTKSELIWKIRTALGGRAAEIVYFGREEGLSTGASGDLNVATKLAERMLSELGMYESFGLAAFDGGERDSSVRSAVNDILKTQLEAAINLICENHEKTDLLAEELIKKNHLTEKELSAILFAK